MSSGFLPVLIQILVAVGFAAVVLVLSVVCGRSARRSAAKDSAYECGMLPVGEGAPRFAVKFYLIAMLFVIFDIEVVFLIPWTFVYREFLAAGIPILAPVGFFLFVLVLGLVYEVKKGALEWEK